MADPTDPQHEIRFGRFSLQPARRVLVADGQPVKLGARAFDLLLQLVQQADRVVAKGELLDRVWPDVVVAENNLEVHIWALRKALGAQAITTVPGRGYRFTEPLLSARASEPDALAAAAAPPAPPPTLRTNLPERLPALIGRAEELAAVARLLDGQSLVTVLGGGGIGKTLLALHLLEHRRHAHEHGVCWVELEALADPVLAVSTIASALGVSLGPGDPLAALVSAMAPLKLLLALDNAEHVVGEVARIAEALLAGAPGVQLLVTSQVPLKVAHECLMRLGPLAVPEAGATVDEALRHGAVALFVERARAFDRHFALLPDTVDAVAELCRRLDGCALAIELAAARVPLLGVQQLAGALHERLQLLNKGRRDAPARQQSLRAALAWSHGLLKADEQLVFRRMAVLAGGAGLELLLAVVCDVGLDRWRALDALDALVDHGLVAVSGSEPPRYRLLESPRVLAAETLAATNEGPALAQRHAAQVLDHFEALSARLRAGTLGSDALVRALEPDLDNGRAALRWALAHHGLTAVALAPALARALTLVRFGECDAMWTATEACLDDAMPAAARAAWLLGAAVFRVDRHARAADAYAQRAVELYRALGDPQGRVRALAVIASSRLEGAAERQQDALREMRELVQPDWPPLLQVDLCKTECLFAYRRGDWNTVETWLRQWLHHADAMGSQANRIAVMSNLADLALAQGRAQEAVALGRELEQRLRHARNAFALSILRMNLTAALLACDEVAAARQAVAEAWQTAPAFKWQSYWLDSLALLSALERRFVTAARLAGRADAEYRAKGEKREANQSRSAERAQVLARAALGAEAYEREAARGAMMAEAQIAALALATGDADGV